MPSTSHHDEAIARLEQELRGPPPQALSQLGAEELQHLATALAHTRQRQAAEIEQAVNRGFTYVPRLLRGPIRKLLG